MSRFPTIPRIPAMAARSRTSGKRRWRESALSAAVMCAVIGLPAAAVPQQASIIGQLSNFDTFNDTGVDAHGFEIELEGVHSADVQYFFGAPYNRYGTPTVTDFTDGARWGARVRWAAVFVQGSGYSATTVPGPANPTPTDGHSCYLYGPAGATQAQYDASGCEHFGIGTWGTPTNTAYHWLIDDGSAPGTLVWSGTSVSVPAPTWSVSNNGAVAAALPALPPAPVAALPGVPACALWGDALWMKIYKTESHQPAKLGALLTDSKDVPQEAAEVETEWKFLQGRPTCDDTGKPLAQQPGNEVVNEAVAGGSAESVTRRYEFYRYTGTYDDTDGGNHEALPLCDSNPYKASCGSPAQAKPNADLGGYIGAQMAAANIGRFGVQAPALSVVKDGDGSGLVADGGGISCGDLCGGNYAAGTKVVLTATPDAGS
ncbi:MAG: hypothetical protein KGP01_07215, partial [Actinomycetales bacterium]|nr:hypothetical protein [Actinomycetales bacterium]